VRPHRPSVARVNPPVQEVFSPAARVSWRKPIASSSRPLEAARVHSPQPGGADHADEDRLGVRVGAGEQHSGRSPADRATARVPAMA